MMIELIATAESVAQAKELVDCGVDILYIGEDEYGLRLPYSFTREEQREVIAYAHAKGAQVSAAVNAIFHNDRINQVAEYLAFLREAEVDSITLGDPGVVQVMREQDLFIPYRYDAQVMVTSSGQINFWAKRGAVGSVLAREVPFEEMKKLIPGALVPVEVLVYGATCIHQSKRNLLENYFNFIEKEEAVNKERGLFISEPKKVDSHYSIYQDRNGTHIFANNDLDLMPHLGELTAIGVSQWMLDGLFTLGENFVAIAKLFVEAREALAEGKWTEELAERLDAELHALHPANRELDSGFYSKDPNEVV